MTVQELIDILETKSPSDNVFIGNEFESFYELGFVESLPVCSHDPNDPDQALIEFSSHDQFKTDEDVINSEEPWPEPFSAVTLSDIFYE